MCGIVGYIGKNNARDIILDGLRKLEYRGYDSAGISFFDESLKKYEVYKDKGRVSDLIKVTPEKFSNIGIGHTRWATHGVPNMVNSHPHVSECGTFIVVHNGVIENYLEIKEKYLKDSILKSDTDTEVIACLVGLFKETLPTNKAIIKTMSLLEGSYALAIIDTTLNDTLYATKSKSPLIIGKGYDEMVIASDLLALTKDCYFYAPVPDKTFITISKDGYKAYDFELNRIELEEFAVDHENIEAGTDGYPHFMMKEIMEQPSVIRNIIKNYFEDNTFKVNKDLRSMISNSDHIHIVAAGTSMNAGFIGKEIFEKVLKVPCTVSIASEMAYNMPLLSKKPLFVFISQSGETADLRAVLVKVKELGHKSLTLTNVKTSTLAREADESLELFAGPEIAVASTKAYTAQIAVLAILAYFVKDDSSIKSELGKIAISMDAILDQRERFEIMAENYLTKRNCFYIGRGIDYYVSLEASLKLKEISYIQTEGFAAGELKHGTIALIENNTPVIGIVTQESIHKNTRSNLKEVESRGAKTLIISRESISNDSDDIVLDDSIELLTPLLSVIPTQFLAYYAALQRGNDIDKPRNLAKSVTVE